MHFVRQFAVAILFSFGCVYLYSTAPGLTQQGQPGITFAPRSKPVIIASDRRLELSEQGALEIGFFISDADLATRQPTMTLIAQENHDRMRFRVSFVESGTRLQIETPGRISSVPFDISDGAGYYQLLINGKGNFVDILPADRNVPLEAAVGFGPMQRLPLYVGGTAAGANSFVGTIVYVRVWNDNLTFDEYAALNSELFYPGTVPDVIDKLALYTEFTGTSNDAYYTSPTTLNDIVADPDPRAIAGKAAGTPFVSLIPADSRIAGMRVSGGDRVTSIQLIVSNADGAVTDLDVHGKALKDGARRQHFLLEGEEYLAGYDYTSLIETRTTTSADGAISWFMTPRLRSFKLITSKGRTSQTFGAAGPPAANEEINSGGVRFSVEPTLDALWGYLDEQGNVEGFGFASPARRVHDAEEGRWILKEDKDWAPQKKAADDGTPKTRHGTYLPREVMSLRTYYRGLTLLLGWDGPEFRIMRIQPDGSFADKRGTVTLRSNRELVLTDTSKGARTTRIYVRPDPYPVITRAGGGKSLADSFNDANYLHFYQRVYRGHDLTLTNPNDFQAAEGRKAKVFREPDRQGMGYYPDNERNVPHGLRYMPDVMSGTSVHTTVIKTGSEHSEFHSRSVGLSIGVPKVMSFGVDSSVHSKTVTAANTESQMVYREEWETNTALIVDHAMAELDPDFRATILRLADLRSRNEPVDWINEVFKVYGTHYTHALVTGSLSRSSLRYNREAFTVLRGRGSSISAHGSATIKKAELGTKFGKDKEFSDTTNRDLSQQTETISGVGKSDKPVPIYLDLRPLNELLSPLYFGDTEIFFNLHAEMRDAIKAYIAGRAPDYSNPAFIFEPYRYGATFKDITLEPIGDGTSEGVFGLFFFDVSHPLTYLSSYNIYQYAPLKYGGTKLTGSWPNEQADVVTDSKTFKLHGQEWTGYVTATEMCNRSLSFEAAATLRHITFVAIGHDEIGSGAFVPHPVFPIDIGSHATISFSTPLKGGNDPTVRVSYYRVPITDKGPLKPLPTCP